jgi:hypothetical protein
MDKTLRLTDLKAGHYYHRVNASGETVYFTWKVLYRKVESMTVFEVSLESPYKREATLDLIMGTIWEHLSFKEISVLQGMLEVGE